MLTIPGNDPAFLIQAAMERIRQLEAEVRRLQKQCNPVEHTIRIFQGNRLIKVGIEDLLFIRAESNYSRVYLKNGEQFLTSRTLKSWINEIPGTDFLRCHRSYLISKKEIVEFERKSHEIILKGGFHIPTSRRFQCKSLKAVFHNEKANRKTSSAKPDCTVRKLCLKTARVGR